jgi:hypothetical protein
LENATTDGVVRDPSAFGITTGSPASKTLTTEFVVPRSIPTALATASHLLDLDPPLAKQVRPPHGTAAGKRSRT